MFRHDDASNSRLLGLPSKWWLPEKISEFQVGIEPTTNVTRVGCSNHRATRTAGGGCMKWRFFTECHASSARLTRRFPFNVMYERWRPFLSQRWPFWPQFALMVPYVFFFDEMRNNQTCRLPNVKAYSIRFLEWERLLDFTWISVSTRLPCVCNIQNGAEERMPIQYEFLGWSIRKREALITSV